MVRTALIGAGKMGLSHLAILGAHPDVEIAGVCDTSGLVTDVLTRYSGFACFSDYSEMINRVKPDAVFVATPTRLHAPVIRELLERGIHVFAEKPFTLSPEEGGPLVELAKRKELVNQVGYHNRFVGTFRHAHELIRSGYLGEITHFQAEAYGPVVTRKKQETWRTRADSGGGCLMDYASHVVDLIAYVISPVAHAYSSILKTIYSKSVDDSVYALLGLENKVTGVLSVNWSDETYRKMSTSISVNGSRGKIISDATEIKVYFNRDECPPGYSKGWNVRYITDLASPVDFYLRGEEYSAQADHFIQAVLGRVKNDINTFESAWQTDKALKMIRQQSEK